MRIVVRGGRGWLVCVRGAAMVDESRKGFESGASLLGEFPSYWITLLRFRHGLTRAAPRARIITMTESR